MAPIHTLIILVAIAATVALIFVAWRWASRVWSVPCPTLFAFALESDFYRRITGTEKTLRRIGLKPGQRVLEIGNEFVRFIGDIEAFLQHLTQLPHQFQ